jgi:polyferredoxin
MGLIAMFSPFRITRTESICIDCAKCAKACPSSLPVDQLIQIRSAECIGCLECVAICPAEGALTLNLAGPAKLRRGLPAWQLAAGIAIVFCGLIGFAKLSDHWQTRLPQEVFLRLVPAADDQHHPMIGDARR